MSTNHLKMGAVKSCGCLSHSPCVLQPNCADSLYVEQFIDTEHNESFLKVGRTVNSTKRRYHGMKMYGHLERKPILLVTERHYRIATLEYLITGRLPCQHASTEGNPEKFVKFYPMKLFDGSTECFQDSAILDICEFIANYFPSEYRKQIELDDENEPPPNPA